MRLLSAALLLACACATPRRDLAKPNLCGAGPRCEFVDAFAATGDRCVAVMFDVVSVSPPIYSPVRVMTVQSVSKSTEPCPCAAGRARQLPNFHSAAPEGPASFRELQLSMRDGSVNIEHAAGDAIDKHFEFRNLRVQALQLKNDEDLCNVAEQLFRIEESLGPD